MSCDELRSLGDVTLAEYLDHTGLELADVYSSNHGWSEMRRDAGFEAAPPGPNERSLLRAVGRLLLLLGVAMQVQNINLLEGAHKRLAHSPKRRIIEP